MQTDPGGPSARLPRRHRVALFQPRRRQLQGAARQPAEGGERSKGERVGAVKNAHKSECPLFLTKGGAPWKDRWACICMDAAEMFAGSCERCWAPPGCQCSARQAPRSSAQRPRLHSGRLNLTGFVSTLAGPCSCSRAGAQKSAPTWSEPASRGPRCPLHAWVRN